MATSNSKIRTAQRVLKSPLVQRLIIWAAPIVFRYIAQQLRNRRTNTSGRKYVRNKAK